MKSEFREYLLRNPGAREEAKEFLDSLPEVPDDRPCQEKEGCTGIRCQEIGWSHALHRGTTTEDQTRYVGYELTVEWPNDPDRDFN